MLGSISCVLPTVSPVTVCELTDFHKLYQVWSSHSRSSLTVNRARTGQEQGKNRLRELICCVQLYNEIRFQISHVQPHLKQSQLITCVTKSLEPKNEQKQELMQWRMTDKQVTLRTYISRQRIQYESK